ncbi:MAG: tetratricopeptide repeat protein [Cyclobacteriaceae bacterium]
MKAKSRSIFFRWFLFSGFLLPLFVCSQTKIPAAPSPQELRQKAINYYCGLPSVNSTETKRIIEELCLKQDKLALAWKGLFRFFGMAGFNINEEEGKALASEALFAFETQKDTLSSEYSYLLYNFSLIGARARTKNDLLLIEDAASKKYLPAMLMIGTQLYYQKKYDQALQYLSQAYDAGGKRAATLLGALYENNSFTGKDVKKSIEWYQKGVGAGDEDAILKLAQLYYKGEELQPNMEECLKWAKKSAAKGHLPTFGFLGEIYLQDNEGKPKNTSMALQSYKIAADRGSREAMLSLGALYYDGSATGLKDDKLAFYWIKKSAEEGEPNAMLLLGKIYYEGSGTSQNLIKARYWINQAALHGIGGGNETPVQENIMATALKYGDFSNTYTRYTYSDGYEEVVDNGPDIVGGIMGGLTSGWLASYQNQQQIIDGVEFIQKQRNKAIYGGTITTTFNTPIDLKRGQRIKITSSGKVVLGMFAGACGPNGLGTRQFDNYSISPRINHGAVMGKINQNPWFKIGTDIEITSGEDGTFALGINDVDYSNNRGYYDIKIEITEVGTSSNYPSDN